MFYERCFLFNTARNIAIDYVSPTPVESIDDASELALFDPMPGLTEMLNQAQRHQVFLTALDAFPERCREVMLLRQLDGFTSQDDSEAVRRRLGPVARLQPPKGARRHHLRGNG